MIAGQEAVDRLRAALAEVGAGNRGMTWAHNAAAFRRAQKRARTGMAQVVAIRKELEDLGYYLTFAGDTITVCERENDL